MVKAADRPPRWPWWRRNRRRVRRGTALVVLLAVAAVAWSLGSALLRPGTDGIAARAAEWARDHGMGRLITWAENQQYQRNQPKVGGGLTGDQRAALRAGTPIPPGRGLPPAIGPIANPALPGEGEWKVVATTATGQPAVLKAMLRPDATHTSYLAEVAWINVNDVRFVLHPGSQEPGHGPWSVPDTIPAAQRHGLVATFNGGFRLKDALAGPFGGYYADGRAVGQLANGVAAEIFRRDGSMTVGLWGRDATLADPTVVAVRENLHLLVDNGQIPASTADGSSRTWGYTIKNAYYVWRSGIGVTATGDIVFAMGSALSVQTLADVLRRAGAVRAMELDINPDWTSFMSYTAGPDPANPVPAKLTAFSRPADRYYQPSSRDFVAAYLRS